MLDIFKDLGFGASKDNEMIGWNGHRPSTPDKFQCEFCEEEHINCTEIPHKPECPVPRIRALF